MEYLQYVNVKQGTASLPRLSRGNTLPLTQLPYGMAAFSPQTVSDRGSFYYHPGHHWLEGVRLTHQPSPWVGDYGHLLLVPQTGEAVYSAEQGWSGYRPEEAVLSPHYMKLDFLRYRSRFELTPTERGAAIRLTSDGTLPLRLTITAFGAAARFSVDPDGRRLTGYTRGHSWQVADNFAMYFVLTFDRPVDAEQTVVFRDKQPVNGLSVEGENTGISVAFSDSCVSVKLAASFISAEQAEVNAERELLSDSFEELREKARLIWEEQLGKIAVETETEEQLRTFYSCLYRFSLFPRKMYEYDRTGKIFHYNADTGRVREGVCYVDNGFWDTYRTVYPLLSVIDPQRYAEILEGFVNTYRDCGWLPKWLSPAELGIMPGTLIDAVIADAAVKGIGSREVLETALEGMCRHAETESGEQRYGRHGTAWFQKLGYIPCNRFRESVNHTLDYVYGDFCIAQTASVLGFQDVAEKYRAYTKNYRLLFDKENGLMRARDEDGNFRPDFEATRWGGDYCEGSAWQNSFAVYHDIDGLAELYGSREAFAQKLDELFATPPVYSVGGYGSEIHEMTEMAAVDFGQCAISNQPSFHIPYLYTMLGQRDKTKYWVKRMMTELFNSGDGGFPGDEDNGTMAAWYLFSAMGFYPVCPGKAEYAGGIQLVKKAAINGREIPKSLLEQDIIPHRELMEALR